MQLGTRWPVGDQPPSRLPAAVTRAVAAVETDIARFDTTGWHWTLTWLEGRPIVELDDGTTLHYDPETDTVTTTEPPAD